MPPQSGKIWTIDEKLRVLRQLGRVAGSRAADAAARVDTVQDDFADLGGPELAQNASTALKWLTISTADIPSEWFNYNANSEYHVEGFYGNRRVEQGSGGGTGAVSFQAKFDPPVDLDSEGRFTDDDFLVFYLYLRDAPDLNTAVSFKDVPNEIALYSAGGSGAWSSGPNFIAIKRSLFNDLFFDWTQVDALVVAASYQVEDVFDPRWGVIDNLQIVKADPLDPDVPNATGGRWRFTDADGNGVHWTILQDMPGQAYALAQLKSHATEVYVAIRQGDYTARSHYAAAVLLREDGAAGLLFCAQDGNNGYVLALDTANDAVKLYERSGGVDTEIGSAAYVCAPNTVYYLGLTRDVAADGTVTLRAYARSTPGNHFEAVHLKIAVDDDTHGPGSIGVISYGVNARWARVRAGSPEHALTAEWAASAKHVTHPDFLLQQVMT
jgi:hypothetical protein